MVSKAVLGVALCAAGLALLQPGLPQTATAFAQAAERDRLAEALALPIASELVGARDVARFAWVENAAGVRNVWVADRGQPARRLTAFATDDGQQLYDLALSPNGTTLAFVRGGDAEFPDDGLPNAATLAAIPRQQLFVTPGIGGTPVLVGDGHSPTFAPRGDRLAFTKEGEIWLWDRASGARKLATVPGDIRRLVWSPDGTRLSFVEARRGDYGFVGLLDVAEARLRYVDPGLGTSVEPAFSPDGRQLAFIRFVEPPASAGTGVAPETASYWSIRVADAASGASRVLWSAPAGVGGRYAGTRSRNLFWSASGQIVFPWERSGWLHPYAIDVRGAGEPRDLTPGAFEVETFVLGADGRSIIYSANAGDIDRRHVWRRPLGAGRPEALTRGQGIETSPAIGGDAIAVIASDATRPAHPALIAGGLKPLGRVAVARGFTPPEAVVFRAEDGLEVHGQLFRGHGEGKRPALVHVHGGPRRQMLLGFHPSSYYSHAYVMNQHLAARGYTVLSVNYRSGTGYGLAFRDAAGTGRDGATEYRDILAGGRWLAARPDVDPSRIGIWGGSWGGYLAALALARDSDLFAAGVDFHGVHSLLRPVPDSLSPDAQAAARQLQWQSSPLGSIERWRSPVLLIHGDDDRNVPFSQSLLLARELAARGIPYRELVFPNERHSFIRHENWLTSLRAMEEFFDQTLVRKEPLR